tara:strand:- start:493 stop:1314 length:822 start_codon:yes stop_codon:yes gene_type:complete
MSKNKKTRLRNQINKTEQANLKKLKKIGGKTVDRISKSIKKNAPKVKSNVKKATKNISKSVKKNAPNLKKQGLKIGKGILKKGKGVGNVAKGIAKGTVKGVGGLAVKAATAKAMYESAKTGVKSWGMKGKDGKRAGLARIPGLIGKAWKNRGKLSVKKLNPASDENKRIREKKASMTKDNAGKIKSQISAIKRKRDDVKLSDVRANQEKKMRDAARKRTEQFKKDKAAKKAGKKTSYEGYKSAYDKRQAERKAAMQRKAKERNKAWKKSQGRK